MMSVQVLVLRGAMPSSVAVTLDVLATANRLRAMQGRPHLFEVALAGSGAAAARAWLEPAPLRPEPLAPALVIIPGLGLSSETEVSARLAQADARRAMASVRAAMAAGAEIATSCSGAFLLAASGVLAGRRATTAWWLAPTFSRMFPAVALEPEAVQVRDGPITTAGAAMAQVDLMLGLVARHGTAGLADQCARYLLLDQRRSQARYMALGHFAASDPRIAKAEAWARTHLDDDISVGDVAQAAGLTPRTLSRRLQRVAGLSPVRFLQKLKVDAALELIETTRLPFEEIARRVGYADPSTLRRLLQKSAGRSPSGLRVAAS
jgi:transcriptional regulator GlxA family with amidase domain